MSITINVSLTPMEAVAVLNADGLAGGPDSIRSRSLDSAEAKLFGALQEAFNVSGFGFQLTADLKHPHGVEIHAEQVAAVQRGLAHSGMYDFEDHEAAAIMAEVAATLLSPAAIERAAEAVHYAQGFDDYGVANDEERQEAESISRAAVDAILGGSRQ